MAEISSQGQAYLDRVLGRIAKGKTTKSAPEMQSGDDVLFQRLAVQHMFDPALALRGADPAMHTRLRQISFVAPGEQRGGARSLNRKARMRYLAQLDGPQAALGLIDSLPARSMTASQELFEMRLRGTLPPLRDLTQSQLIRLREVMHWTDALGMDPIPEGQLALAESLAAVVASFQHLKNEHFVGRTDNIRDLLEFLGLAPKGFLAQAAELVGAEPPRVMFIEGVGGIGKTALMGHVLNKYHTDATGPKYAFAYMACDDPTLDILTPEAMLAEAATQLRAHADLATQFGSGPTFDTRERFSDIIAMAFRSFDYAAVEFSQQRLKNSERSSGHGSQVDRLDETAEVFQDYLQSFSHLLKFMSSEVAGDTQDPSTVVLIIDTFEDVQMQSEAKLNPFWDCLRDLLAMTPCLRVIIAGRHPLMKPDLGVASHEINMQELDDKAAVQLLQRETGADKSVLQRLTRHIGRNPLNLRLVARLLADGDEDLSDIQTRSRLFQRLGPEIIRGRLYQRVLDHLQDSDPRVRKLAHPGMILRRITPEVIRDVLAAIADIEVDGLDDAQRLFEALAREHTLVKRDDDGALRYHAEIRRPVLELLKADQPEMTRRAHEAACEFYGDNDSPEGVAEFIYHNLMLGPAFYYQLVADLQEGSAFARVKQLLAGALPELPPDSQLTLATMFDLALTDDVRGAADTAAWEQIVGPRVLQALASGRLAGALDMLRERRDRTPDSPLFAIEARCLMSAGDPAAHKLLLDVLDAYPVNGNQGRRAELSWLLAQVQRQMGNGAAATATLVALADAADSLISKLPLIQVLSVLASDVAYKQRLADALALCSNEMLERETDVIRHAFANLHVDHSPRVPHVALGIVSSMYDMVSRAGRFEMTREIMDGLRHTYATRLPREGAAKDAVVDDLTGSALRAMSTNPLTSATFLSLISLSRGAIAQATSPDNPEVAIACRAMWWLAQAVTGTLDAATLGGLDAYRDPWELNAAVEVQA